MILNPLHFILYIKLFCVTSPYAIMIIRTLWVATNLSINIFTSLSPGEETFSCLNLILNQRKPPITAQSLCRDLSYSDPSSATNTCRDLVINNLISETAPIDFTLSLPVSNLPPLLSTPEVITPENLSPSTDSIRSNHEAPQNITPPKEIFPASLSSSTINAITDISKLQTIELKAFISETMKTNTQNPLPRSISIDPLLPQSTVFLPWDIIPAHLKDRISSILNTSPSFSGNNSQFDPDIYNSLFIRTASSLDHTNPLFENVIDITPHDLPTFTPPSTSELNDSTGPLRRTHSLDLNDTHLNSRNDTSAALFISLYERGRKIKISLRERDLIPVFKRLQSRIDIEKISKDINKLCRKFPFKQ